MTFDEAMAIVGTYLTNNDLSNSDNNDRFFYTILNDLRQEYAPTVEMTTFERTNAVGLLDFKRDELTFVVGSSGDGEPILDTLPKRYFSAWLHPETIKVVDE